MHDPSGEASHEPRAERERGGHPILRSVLALVGVVALLGLAVATLWYQDWRYSLPTPRPARLAQVPLGERVAAALPESALPVADGRVLFLHFTSSDCPCSRFASEHVRELVRTYGGRVRFVAIEEGAGGSALDLGIPEVPDPEGRIAARCGVYSTPQAVVLGPDERLWYRGNYNASRYCSDPASAYARLALEALLDDAPRPEFPARATRAYGCALPGARTLE